MKVKMTAPFYIIMTCNKIGWLVSDKLTFV